MKNLFILSATSILLLPVFTFAQSGGLAGTDDTAGGVGKFLGAILKFIDGVLIPVVLGVAFLVFVWGVFKYFILGGADSEKQESGKSLMLYAVVGFVLIIAFYGIVNLISNGLGFGNDDTLDATIETGFKVEGAGSNSTRR